MLFSLILRSFKTYNRQSYIPISDGSLFSAFIGENGIGKSSVIEALDTYFNKSNSDWNFNHAVLGRVYQNESP